MKLVSSGYTDQGNVRTNNEDSFGCFDELSLYILADGMGGHNAGEVASRVTVNEIAQYFRNNLKSLKAKSDIKDFIRKAIRHANRIVYTRSQKNESERGMGTTVVVIFFRDKKAYVGWVGDSRAYISRLDPNGGRFISQISTDHSLVQEQIAEGLITQQEADQYNIKDIITRAVGFQPDVAVDCVVLKELFPGDIFMSCSDGYYRYYKIEEIGNTFLKNEAKQLPQLMVEQAKRSGGEDNVTIVTVEVISSDETRKKSKKGKNSSHGS